MVINHQVLVTDNGYLNDNVIKYAYENNIRLLILDWTESSKNNLKLEESICKGKFHNNWRIDSFICPIGEQLHYKNDRKLNG